MLMNKLKEDLSDIVKYSLLSITYLIVIVLLILYVVPRRIIQNIISVITHKKRTEDNAPTNKQHDSNGVNAEVQEDDSKAYERSTPDSCHEICKTLIHNKQNTVLSNSTIQRTGEPYQ